MKTCCDVTGMGIGSGPLSPALFWLVNHYDLSSWVWINVMVLVLAENFWEAVGGF